MRVVVIGAGFAGLSAAVRLAAAGRRVVVVEEAPRLGGRATAFTDRETGERVDNGQHVLFGCYRETYSFLNAVGAADLAPLQPRLSLAIGDVHGRMTRLACPPWPPPLHLVGGILRWRALPLRDRLTAARLAPVLLASRRRGAAAIAADVPADWTVDEWLARQRQSPALCEWLWHPLAIAALNESPSVAAARPFVRVLAEMFGPNPRDSAVGLPRVPLDEVFAEPARRFIEARGGTVSIKASARVVLDDDGAVGAVRVAGERIETRQVISSVPWHAFGRLWDAGVPPPLAPIAANAAALASSPIVSVNLWFDGSVGLPERFVGLIGGPFQWAFDKGAILAQPDGRGHIALVASGAADLVDLENAELAARAVEQLQQTVASTRGARLRRAVAVREHRATFSVAPGLPPRPGTRTPLRGFYLAGDWIDTGLPGTIESAVVSGHRAADAALAER